jgi:hypothetical protein
MQVLEMVFYKYQIPDGIEENAICIQLRSSDILIENELQK